MKTLDVYAGSVLAGHLSEDDADGLVFVYASGWLTHPEALPLAPDFPLAAAAYQGPRVKAYFDNLLPEGDIRGFIAKAAHISPGNVFGLLRRFGGDTAGAFSLLPQGELPSGEPHYLPVTGQAIRQWFEKSRGIPLDLAGEQARMSLSGAQDKMTVFIDRNGSICIPLGSAPSSHIVKPSVTHRADVPNTAVNEAFVMKLARATGLEVADVRYAPEMSAVVVARYDREVQGDGKMRRLHQNDLCQVIGIGADKKYESEGGPTLQACFEAVARNSVQPAADKKRLIEWVAFNVIVGNMDSHAKNLSLVADGGSGRARLAPFYDMVCTAVYPNLSRKFAFKIGGENRPPWMMKRHWNRFADEVGVKPTLLAKVVSDVLDRVLAAMPSVKAELEALASRADELAMIHAVSEWVAKSATTLLLRLGTNDSSTFGAEEFVDEEAPQASDSPRPRGFSG